MDSFITLWSWLNTLIPFALATVFKYVTAFMTDNIYKF